MLLNLLFWVICAYLIAHTLSAETSSFMFSLRDCKDMANLLYWVLGHAWLCTPKKIATYQLVENFCVWQAKMNFVPHVFPDIYIYLYIYIYIYIWTSYIRYFGYVRLRKLKMIVLTWRKLRCLSACKKINFIIHFFLWILHFKESCSLISQQNFDPQLENQNFASHGIGGEISIAIFWIFQKTLFWGHFEPFLPKFGEIRILLEKRTLSVFKCSNYLTSWKKLEFKIITHSWERCWTAEHTDK